MYCFSHESLSVHPSVCVCGSDDCLIKVMCTACVPTVLVQDQGHNKKPYIPCRVHIFKTDFRIFMKLGSDVYLIMAMCRSLVSMVHVQGQDYNIRLNV